MEPLYSEMKVREVVDMPKATYMTLQPDMTRKTREILVDWMAESVDTFGLQPEVLFLGVRLMDMFLSKKQVSRARCQLLATACLGLASAYHEDTPPYIEDWVWITAGSCTRDEVARMQRIICKVIDYNVTTPTVFEFLHECANLSKPGTKCVPKACLYLAQLSLMDYAMIRFRPSLVAAACLRVVNSELAKEEHTGYSKEDLAPVIAELHRVQMSPLGEMASIKSAYPERDAIHGSIQFSTSTLSDA